MPVALSQVELARLLSRAQRGTRIHCFAVDDDVPGWIEITRVWPDGFECDYDSDVWTLDMLLGRLEGCCDRVENLVAERQRTQ